MFDNYLVRADSLRNEVVDGETIGFSLAVRHANYRGVYLSLVVGYFIEIDGVEYPVSVQSFEINGEAPRGFDALKTQVWERWHYGDEAILHIAKPGGLASGAHKLRFQQCVIAAYGYLPTDEAWVQAPPKPGTGAGSDKTPHIVTYHLPLTAPAGV